MLAPDQRLTRRALIGSSDAAAILGYDPFRNAFDVWARMTGRLPDDGAAGPAAELGHYLEAGLLDYVQDKLGVPLARHVQLFHPDGIAACNLDAVAPAPVGQLVEAKVSGLLGRPEYADAWGEAGTDELPAHVMIQVHHQFLVANAQPDLADVDHAIVIALLGFRGFVRYDIHRNDTLVAALAEREQQFVTRYVTTDTRPPALPRMETLKQLLRQTDVAPVAIDEGLVAAWRAAADAKRAAAAAEEDAKRAVIAALGDGEAGTCGLGTLTFKEQTRAGYTAAPVTYRVLRLAQPKPRRRAA